jgi:predicted metal-binding membrane protein
MNRSQRIILTSIIAISVASWILSKDQPDMMKAMMSYNTVAISLFMISWTIGMAAMMFPAITPMVLLYSSLIKGANNIDDRKGIYSSASSVAVEGGGKDGDNSSDRREDSPLLASSSSSLFNISINVIFFIGSYLFVWAITGIVLLLTWSIPMSYFFLSNQQQQLQIIYGIILISSGLYQFTSLKRKCLGYCESPFSFFMRRWKSGTVGALKMGIYHGLYCLGCCWPYFLLMVAIGWMNLLWMSLFAGVIFGEKIWSRGIWIARGAGITLAIVGILAVLGLVTLPAPNMVPLIITVV